MPEPISADHIAGAGGGFEPVRKNNFLVELPVGGQVVQQALESFPLPRESNPPINVNYGNEIRKVAGVATFEDLELVLKDFVDEQVAQAMVEWRREVYNPEGGVIGRASSYKRQGTVTMYGPDGTPSQRWKLIGVWPSAMNGGDGNMSDNTVNLISITLTIDKATLA